MKRVILILGIAALALPTVALGKGPSGASISGPGDGGGITFTGDGESGGTQLGNLTQLAGFFPATFGQEPSPMLPGRPKGDLGPKYTVTYIVPTGTALDQTIRQDVYPYAEPAPVTFMKPGQRIFEMQTHGGWFQADSQLKVMLVSAGLAPRPPSGTSNGWSVPTLTAGALTLLLLLGVTAVLVRRRTKPAARMAGSPS